MPLVSVVVPCFNVEKKIVRLLRSLVNQDYRPLEIIFVDDGSTDGTSKTILDFKEVYTNENFLVKYILQENRGAASAVNTGLKYVNGDYLIWPDADDWLENQSISKRVDFLEKNTNFSIVTSNVNIFTEKDLKSPIDKLVKKETEEIRNENQFELLLKDRSFIYCGSHMIRMSDFLSVCPNKNIYESKFGQNLQMLMLIYYRGKRFFLDECLYNYVIYENSFSHKIKSLEEHYSHYDGYEDIINNTLEQIDMSPKERDKYRKIAFIQNVKKHFYTAAVMGGGEDVEKFYKILKDNNSLDIKIKMRRIISNYRVLSTIEKKIRRMM